MQWDCQAQGCFNWRKRPKIEIFADCLPGKIAFSDVDAIVEIGGNFLMIEWKSHGDVPRGQRILFQRLTQFAPVTVFIVEGDAETMEVDSIRFVSEGKMEDPFQADQTKLRELITQWNHWAGDHPVTHQGRITHHTEQMTPAKEVTI